MKLFIATIAASEDNIDSFSFELQEICSREGFCSRAKKKCCKKYERGKRCKSCPKK
jgi:hypothetical protein